MPEKIYIDGFAGLRNFEMELNRITVLIGPQASGKSVVAKLVYFFNEVVLNYIRTSLFDDNSNFPEFIKQEFKKTFNLNLIKNKFTIKYERHNFKAIINQNEKLHVEADAIEATQLLNNLKGALKPLQQLNPSINIGEFYKENFSKMGEAIGVDVHNANFFIPASRSFTSLIKNIKLLVENHEVPAAIDRFLLKFSSVYQQHRQQFKYEDETLLSKETNSFDAFTKALINANVEFINDEDYLVYDDGRRVALTNASSGEQALIPVLAYLKKLHQKGKSKLKTYLFFEEPELHIFPKFQFTLMQLLMFVFNECNVRLFITTHSPYILSAMSTFTQAGDLANGKYTLEKEVIEVLRNSDTLVGDCPENAMVKPDDMLAYQISNGKVENLNDPETNLIGENLIDNVSEMDYKLFDELSDLILTTK